MGEINALRNLIIQDSLNTHLEILGLINNALQEQISRLAAILIQALANGNKIFWCGNGGSAADAQHLAAELVGRFMVNRNAYASIALTTDSSVLTCISNDFGYENVFSRQVEALGCPNDVLVALSTSGLSPNICNALTAAHIAGLRTIAMLGKDGGPASNIAEFSLIVPSFSTPRIQEMHILIGHIICEIVEKELELS